MNLNRYIFRWEDPFTLSAKMPVLAFPCALQALMLENLQKSSSSHGGLQPNSQV